jgi:hypothetical protein
VVMQPRRRGEHRREEEDGAGQAPESTPSHG